MPQFEEIVREYVRVRAQEYYKWKDYQYAIKYAGRKMINKGFINFDNKIKIVSILRLKLLHKPRQGLY